MLPLPPTVVHYSIHCSTLMQNALWAVLPSPVVVYYSSLIQNCAKLSSVCIAVSCASSYSTPWSKLMQHALWAALHPPAVVSF